MKKFVLASVSVLALFGVAACSDSADTTTTQSVPDAQMNEPAPASAEPAPMEPAPESAPAQ